MTRTTIRASQCKHIIGFHTDIHFMLPVTRLDRSRPLCPECISYGVKVLEGNNILDGLYGESVVTAQGDSDIQELGARAYQVQVPPPAFPSVVPTYDLPGGGSTLAFRAGPAPPPSGTFGHSQSQQPQQQYQQQQQHQVQTQVATQAPRSHGATSQEQRPDYLASILSTYKKHHLDTYYPYPHTHPQPTCPSAPYFATCSSTYHQHPQLQQEQQQQQHQSHYNPKSSTNSFIQSISRLSLHDRPFNPFAPASMPQDTYFSTIRTIPAQEQFLRAGNEGFLFQIQGGQRPFSAEDWATCVMMRMCESGATSFAEAERELWETIERLTRGLTR